MIEAATSGGLAVPRDLSVVGFDDDPLAAAGRSALTSVRQDLGAKGRAAAHAVFEAIAIGDGSRGGRQQSMRIT